MVVTTVAIKPERTIQAVAAYNFGAFTLGAGVMQQQKGEGTYAESIIAVTAPLGALTLGFDFGTSQRKDSTIASQDVSKSGYGLRAAYALSKRTSLIGAYTNWDEAKTDRANKTELLVSHTF